MEKKSHFTKQYMKQFFSGVFFFLMLIYGISSFASYQSIQDQRELVEKKQGQAISTLHRELIEEIQKVSHDLKLLTEDPLFLTFISGEGKNRGAIISQWIDFMQISGSYQYISFVNLIGEEVIRVNTQEKRAYGVADIQLKNVENSTFYREASQVRKNFVYFSSLEAIQSDSQGNDFNAAVPVYDFYGYKRGLFQMNYITKILTSMMDDHAQIFNTHLMLIQEDGKILCSDQGSGQLTEVGPNQLEIISILTQSEDSGQLETKNGRYTYESLSPVSMGEEAGIRMSLKDEKWVLLAHATPNEFFFLNGKPDWKNGLMMGLEDLRRYGLIALLAAFLFAEFRRFRQEKEEAAKHSQGKIDKITMEYQDLMDALIEMLEQASIVTSRDQENHGVRVGKYVKMLAEHSRCTDEFIQEIVTYSVIHDIGKIGIKGSILAKEESLSAGEFNEITQHVQIGYNLIRHLNLGKIAENLVLYHHERWDGNGYLHGLEADQIPLEARILAIADCYDALRMDKPQRRGLDHPTAIKLLLEGKGTKYDPNLLEIVEKHQGEFYQIFERNK
jgi:HD-GYP domain-containing protein (c-di-GMP phosphodiesterase class II)